MTMTTLIQGRLDALKEGNAKKAAEYDKRIAEAHMYLGEILSPALGNAMLTVFKCGFPPLAVVKARRIEVWSTTLKAPTDFSLVLLIDDGEQIMESRHIAGY
jgi:hypothetical protein